MRALQAFQRVTSSLGAAQTTNVAAAILGAGSCRLRGLATSAVAREQGKVGLGAVGRPPSRCWFAEGSRAGAGGQGSPACGCRRAAAPAPPFVSAHTNIHCMFTCPPQPEPVFPDALDQEFDRGEE